MSKSIYGNSQINLTVNSLNFLGIESNTITSVNGSITNLDGTSLTYNTGQFTTLNVSSVNLSSLSVTSINISSLNSSAVNTSNVNSSVGSITTLSSANHNCSTSNISSLSVSDLTISNTIDLPNTVNVSTLNSSSMNASVGIVTTLSSANHNCSTSNISSISSSEIINRGDLVQIGRLSIAPPNSSGSGIEIDLQQNNIENVNLINASNGNVSTLATVNHNSSNSNISSLNVSTLTIDNSISLPNNTLNVSSVNSSSVNASVGIVTTLSNTTINSSTINVSDINISNDVIIPTTKKFQSGNSYFQETASNLQVITPNNINLVAKNGTSDRSTIYISSTITMTDANVLIRDGNLSLNSNNITNVATIDTGLLNASSISVSSFALTDVNTSTINSSDINSSSINTSSLTSSGDILSTTSIQANSRVRSSAFVSMDLPFISIINSSNSSTIINASLTNSSISNCSTINVSACNTLLSNASTSNSSTSNVSNITIDTITALSQVNTSFNVSGFVNVSSLALTRNATESTSISADGIQCKTNLEIRSQSLNATNSTILKLQTNKLLLENSDFDVDNRDILNIKETNTSDISSKAFYFPLQDSALVSKLNLGYHQFFCRKGIFGISSLNWGRGFFFTPISSNTNISQNKTGSALAWEPHIFTPSIPSGQSSALGFRLTTLAYKGLWKVKTNCIFINNANSTRKCPGITISTINDGGDVALGINQSNTNISQFNEVRSIQGQFPTSVQYTRFSEGRCATLTCERVVYIDSLSNFVGIRTWLQNGGGIPDFIDFQTLNSTDSSNFYFSLSFQYLGLDNIS